jgi:hypothetical protein
MNDVSIKHGDNIYPAHWIEDLSSMRKDIAVLKVRDPDINSLQFAKETTPLLSVSIWGFTQTTETSFPIGREVSGKLSTIMTSIELPEEHIIGDNKPWNKKLS